MGIGGCGSLGYNMIVVSNTTSILSAFIIYNKLLGKLIEWVEEFEEAYGGTP